MTFHIRRWGNSAAIRLPAQMLAAAGLKPDDRVDVREENGRIVIEKAEGELSLDELIDGITPENRHDVIDWGPPVGKEIW
jgi:antitoxin MazE